MTFEALEVELERLSGLRFPPKDYQTHWEGLRTMPLDALQRAVQAAAVTCVEFPTPAELRRLADAARPVLEPLPDRSAPLEQLVVVTAPFLSKPIRVTREWVYYCEACSDAGLVSHWCGPDGPTRTPWQDSALCGRPQDHAPHEWVAPCACADHNPAIQRRKALTAALVRPQTKTTRGDHA